MTDHTERARLLEAAVQGVAWALIEDDTDTSDRGVSEEHYVERVADARRMLPELIEREPVVVDDAMVERFNRAYREHTQTIDERRSAEYLILWRCVCGNPLTPHHRIRAALTAALTSDGERAERESVVVDDATLTTIREMRAESGRHSAHEVAALDLVLAALTSDGVTS